MNSKFIFYEDFGAIGDGVTDDFAAIKKAHDYANEMGLAVKARPDAHYYIHDTRIGGKAETVVIKTDTYWDSAEFTIDDRDIDCLVTPDIAETHIFTVKSDYETEKIDDSGLLSEILCAGLGRKTSNINLRRNYPVMIIPYNSKHTVCRRKGYDGFMGGHMHEIILLDKDGNVDKSTPIMFDYSALDYIELYRLDIKPITIKGGIFTTRACRLNARDKNERGETISRGYYSRGLDINRPYTTVEGLRHYVTDEFTPREYAEKNLHAVPYVGFFRVSFATHITLKDCILSGRRYYNVQGTYDFNAYTANKVILDGCVQHNFWVTYDEKNDIITPVKRDDPGAVISMSYITVSGKRMKMHWGLGGTNFCKNVEYINSVISRFDAHSSLCNGKIINCSVNYMALTGVGEFTVENTDWYSEGYASYDSTTFFPTREDYGCTWEGTIKVKNFNAYIYTNPEAVTSALTMHKYHNWYFGYTTHMPSISLENLKVYDIITKKPVNDGFQINLIQEPPAYEPAMHLEKTSSVPPSYPYVDKDGDGLVDNTDVPYSRDRWAYNWDGVPVTGSNKNLNMVVPPEYVRIVECEKYVFNVPKTYDEARAIPDINGNANEGFFGSTKFYFGEGEGEYYQGTNHTNTKVFNFKQF